jgi:hypothetical protein
MATTWGLCRDCKWWQIEPDSKVELDTVGQCIDEELQGYALSISGIGGCNRFMKGEPARARGAGDQPPTAAPQR